MRRLLGAAMAVLVSACAFPGQVQRIAIDYDEAIANTSNALTFLNIVRARERHPLHFTAISAMRGSISLDASLGTGLNVDRGTIDSGDAGTSVGVSTGPSFDVAILNSQEFQRGVLQPVPANLVGYFLEQGWPREFIAALFVERIEFVARDDREGLRRGSVIAQLENDPDEVDGVAFSRFIACYHLQPVVVPGGERRLVDYEDLRSGSTLGDVAVLDGTAFDMVEADPRDGRGPRRFIARRSPPSDRLALVPGPDQDSGSCSIPATGDRAGATALVIGPAAAPGAAEPTGRIETQGHIIVPDGGRRLSIDGVDHEVDTRIVLRSPVGVIYFLGEYARSADPYLVRGEKLIDVRLGESRDAFVATRLAGRSYFIPATAHGRSLQTLAIVQQIVNLQKSASELPGTGAVQIVR